MNINKTLFPIGAPFTDIARMRRTFDDLQVQLATGKLAQTLSDVGSGRGTDIDLRHKLSRSAAYDKNITMVKTRLDVMDLALSRMDTIETDARAFAAADAAGEHELNLATAQNFAKAHLDEVVSLLNSEIGGRYLFAGGNTEQAPVEKLSVLLDGEGGRDGFRTIVSQRKAADAGAAGLGRLTLGAAANVVSLAEDGTHPFGFKLSGASTDSLGVSISAPAGAPPSMGITFAGQPNAGEKVYVTLTLPDGTSRTLNLEATNGPASADTFVIGTTTTDTANNFKAALQSRLASEVGTTLSAASVFAAAENFFNGPGDSVQRVGGPPYDSATTLVAATPSDTVMWYKGTSSTDPRHSVTARIGEHTSIGYGAEANEKGFLELMRSLAAVSVETFSASDPTAKARYDALTDRQTARLGESQNNQPGSVEVIAMELGVVRANMGSYQELGKNYRNQLETVISEMEDAPVAEVAVRLQNLQTRLEASYKTMSIVSQLSLVNYLR